MSNITHRNERGFTLVELSIVLVIIGLLIGAVLKGQELIESARLKSQITQLDSYRTATGIFRDRFTALPGDFNDATVRLGANYSGVAIANGDGDGDVEGNGSTGESAQYWLHLAAADLISGVGTTAGAIQNGGIIPDGKAGGFVQGLGVNTNGTDTNWLRLGNANGLVAANTRTLLSGGQAGQLDTQFDDGVPDEGDLQATGGACVNAGVYRFTNDGADCLFFMKME